MSEWVSERQKEKETSWKRRKEWAAIQGQAQRDITGNFTKWHWTCCPTVSAARFPLPPTPLAAPLFQPLLPRVDASFVLPSQPWGKNASRCSQLMRRMVLLSEAHNWHRARVTGAGGWAQRPGARARTFSRGCAVNLLHKSALNRPSKQFSSS